MISLLHCIKIILTMCLGRWAGKMPALNLELWLTVRSSKMGLSCPSGDSPLCRSSKIVLLFQLFVLDGWIVASRCISVDKRNKWAWPISSHLDLTNLINKPYTGSMSLTSHIKVGTSWKGLPKIFQVRALRDTSNTRDSVSSGYPDTKKRVVENTTRSGVFLTKFEVFG